MNKEQGEDYIKGLIEKKIRFIELKFINQYKKHIEIAWNHKICVIEYSISPSCYDEDITPIIFYPKGILKKYPFPKIEYAKEVGKFYDQHEDLDVDVAKIIGRHFKSWFSRIAVSHGIREVDVWLFINGDGDLLNLKTLEPVDGNEEAMCFRNLE